MFVLQYYTIYELQYYNTLYPTLTPGYVLWWYRKYRGDLVTGVDNQKATSSTYISTNFSTDISTDISIDISIDISTNISTDIFTDFSTDTFSKTCSKAYTESFLLTSSQQRCSTAKQFHVAPDIK